MKQNIYLLFIACLISLTTQAANPITEVKIPLTLTFPMTDSPTEKVEILNISSSDYPNISKSDFNWTSSDKEIINVKYWGEITLGGKAGTATLTVKFTDWSAAGYPAYTSNVCTVTVSVAEKPVQSIQFEKSTVTLAPLATEKLTTRFTPSDASFKKLKYASSNTDIVSVDANGTVTAEKLQGQATITATSAEGGRLTTCLFSVVNDHLVTDLTPLEEQVTLEVGDIYHPEITVLPANAMFKDLIYSLSSTGVVGYTVNGNTFEAKKPGTIIVTATTVDGSGVNTTFSLTVKERVYAPHGDYTTGTFFLNEDWFGHFSGSINYLTSDKKFMYKAYQGENAGEQLGTTSQFGTIYGDRVYILSKQGNRMVIADAKTLKKIASLTDIGGDGRSFVGVTPEKGYIGTSKGIFTLDLKTNQVGKQIEGTTSAQVGLMERTSLYVFAVQQGVGVVVIDPTTDKLIATIADENVSTLTQSMDGFIWAARNNALLKIDPQTFKMEVVDLPTVATIAASWGAWNAGSLCADIKNNVLFWQNKGNFFRYEIGNASSLDKVLFSITELGGSTPAFEQMVYGAGCRMDSRTNELIVVTIENGYGSHFEKNWVHIVDATTGQLKQTILPKDYYWFPAVPFFSDVQLPVVAEITSVELAKDSEPTTVSLSGLATDGDNLSAAIVCTVVSTSKPELLSAAIDKEGNLLITPAVGGVGEATILLRFTSNGKSVEKELLVRLGKGAGLDQENDADRRIVQEGGQLVFSNLEGFIFTLHTVGGSAMNHYSITERVATFPIHQPAGIYLLHGTNGRDHLNQKLIISQ